MNSFVQISATLTVDTFPNNQVGFDALSMSQIHYLNTIELRIQCERVKKLRILALKRAQQISNLSYNIFTKFLAFVKPLDYNNVKNCR